MVISKQNYDDVPDYINQYGELGLGMEFLIDWLLDSEIKITRAQLKRIEKAMAVMGLSNTERLKKKFEYRQRGIAKGSPCCLYFMFRSNRLISLGQWGNTWKTQIDDLPILGTKEWLKPFKRHLEDRNIKSLFVVSEFYFSS